MTPTDLRTRYPVFASVPDAAVQYWLDDAADQVPDLDTDTDRAIMALAAHSMATTPGVLASGSVSLPAGVTSFRSGSFSATISDAAADMAAKGGFSTTIYGQEYARLLRRHNGGPRLVGLVC